MSPDRQRRPLPALLARHRVTIVVALVVSLISSGTVAAVSYLVLGSINTAAATTTLKSGVDGAVLQVTNTNKAGGTSARGLGVTVPAGRAPITVNSGAGSATNLSADKLDGIDSTAFARGKGVKNLANRLVLGNGDVGTTLLELPGLGSVTATCERDSTYASIDWANTTTDSIDLWYDYYDKVDAFVVPAGFRPISVAYWHGFSSPRVQHGTTLGLGHGNSPGPRQTASVALNVYRSAQGAPCGVQATATIWSTP